MSGRCDARPELAARPIALDIRIPALPRRGGAALAERFFCPLGWTVDARPVPLDPELPSWGDSRYVDLRLQEELRLADALNHLHVLLPVLDDAKHYSVGSDEVDKLIRAGEGWAPTGEGADLGALSCPPQASDERRAGAPGRGGRRRSAGRGRR